MAKKRYYQLSYPSILMYYNLLGIDIRTININQIETQVSDLDYLVPSELYQLPESSQKISIEWLAIIERMCTSFGYSNEEAALQQLYMESVIGILNTVTSLNLMEEGREDYTLHFKRLSEILSLVLHEINTMSVEVVCIFYEVIKSSLSDQIYKKVKSYPFICAFGYLAMNDDSEIEDYKMFEDENSSTINLENLRHLITENVHKNDKYEYIKMDFRRLSYDDSNELSPKNR